MAATVNSPEELLDLAKLGRKLKPKERQEVVLWLERNGDIESYSDSQLAKILQCKSSSIKTYVRKARQTLAAAISAEDAMQYFAQYLRSTDSLIREAKSQIKQCPGGTGVHLGYMRLLKEIEAEKIEKLQSIGVIPKELGRLTAIEEEWVASVSDTGVASVTQLQRDEDGTA